MKPLVWVNDHLIDDQGLARLAEHYRLVVETRKEKRREVLESEGCEIEAILTFGSTGLSADELPWLPRLKLLQCMGVGYEKVDVEAARRRGVIVTNARGSNDVCVADHVMALMLAITRDVVVADRVSHRNDWNGFGRTPPIMSGKRLGIFGLGRIGSRVAERAMGFQMEIAYHNRRRRAGVPYEYFPSLRALAERSDYLVICAPGGEATRHLVDEEVISRLPAGAFLVNVGRGSIVDTGALVRALRGRRIAGAALDVLEGEPHVSPEVASLENLVLTPHIAGISPESNEAALRIAMANLKACFAGEPPLTPV